MAAIGFEMKLSKYRGRIRSVVGFNPPNPPQGGVHGRCAALSQAFPF